MNAIYLSNDEVQTVLRALNNEQMRECEVAINLDLPRANREPSLVVTKIERQLTAAKGDVKP